MPRDLCTFGLTLALAALPALLGGCNSVLGSTDEAADETETDGGEADEGGSICTDEDPCPEQQSCVNGLCALGCTTDADCADDQYCDAELDHVCKADEVPTCSDDDDCAASQICMFGYCVVPPESTDCQVDIYMDGCESNAICMEDFDTMDTACYPMPPCGEDGSCPVGIYGAVCNTGYLLDKDAICLLGMCATVEHCPANWFCVRYTQNDPLGVCSGGGLGEPCTSDDECLSGACFALPGLPGFCQ